MPTKSKTTKAATGSSLSGLARLGYFYLITFLSLMTFAVGAASFVNVVLETYILPPAVQSYGISDALSMQLRNEFTPYDDQSNKVKTISMEDAKRLVKQADDVVKNYNTIDISARNRVLSLSIVLIFVGGCIYLWHRKETMSKLDAIS